VWGAATGLLVGDTITHVDFRDYYHHHDHSVSAPSIASAESEAASAVDTGELFNSNINPATSRYGGILEGSFGALGRLQAAQGRAAFSVEGLSAATVLAGNEVSGESGSLALSWFGGRGTWHKEVKQHKYRFVRLTVTATTRQDNTRRDTKNKEGQMRETTNSAGAFVHLNEVVSQKVNSGEYTLKEKCKSCQPLHLWICIQSHRIILPMCIQRCR